MIWNWINVLEIKEKEILFGCKISLRLSSFVVILQDMFQFFRCVGWGDLKCFEFTMWGVASSGAKEQCKHL